MNTQPPSLFLVEHRLTQITESELGVLQAALAEACLRFTARGEPVSYLGSTFLPGSERLLSLFKAANAGLVKCVSNSSHMPVACLESAVGLPAPIIERR